MREISKRRVHTRVLENKMRLHGRVLRAYAMLARRMPMELSKLVIAIGGRQGAISEDDLKPRAQVLELRGRSLRDVNAHGAARGDRDAVGADVDRRLVLAVGALRVVSVDVMPVEGAGLAFVVEVEGVGVSFGTCGLYWGNAAVRRDCYS